MHIKSKAIGLVAAGLLLNVAYSSKASALDFSFSFSNNSSISSVSVNGTVTGVIKGLTDNSTSAATEIYLTGYPSGLGANPNSAGNVVFSSSTGWGTPTSNSFTVNNGQITSYDFYVSGANGNNYPSEFYFNHFPGVGQNYLSFGNGSADSTGQCNSICVINRGGNNGITSQLITSQAVPFDFSPSEGVVLGVPLFIGLRILKKQITSKRTTSKMALNN